MGQFKGMHQNVVTVAVMCFLRRCCCIWCAHVPLTNHLLPFIHLPCPLTNCHHWQLLFYNVLQVSLLYLEHVLGTIMFSLKAWEDRRRLEEMRQVRVWILKINNQTNPTFCVSYGSHCMETLHIYCVVLLLIGSNRWCSNNLKSAIGNTNSNGTISWYQIRTTNFVSLVYLQKLPKSSRVSR